MKMLTVCFALVAATLIGLPRSPSSPVSTASLPAPLAARGGDDQDDNDTSDEDFTGRTRFAESLAA